MKIGIIIKNIRKSKRIKQKDLATKLGISNAYLSSVENDKKEPSLGLTKDLATHLGVPLYYFFIKAYDEKSLVGKQKKVFVKVKKLIDEFLKLQAKNEPKD
jgi:transcriptional regulator with XRE-family HTH domain